MCFTRDIGNREINNSSRDGGGGGNGKPTLDSNSKIDIPLARC